MHSVLGGLLMLMMTCKEEQDLSLPLHSSSHLQDCLFAEGAHIFALLYYAE